MQSKTKKIILMAIGWLFVLIGAIGVVVPVLPTTPFLLISLWAFSQSSDRFHAWLYNHRFFGPPLRDWEAHGIIPLRAKTIALATMAISAILVITLTQTPWYGITGMLLLMGVGAGFILTRPSKRKCESRIS
ncbi:YbaN family protein [Sneathiella glossodoripedis]|uniref:YbaN family protein n=1 Tax=Sneathiella glossodoripedis TaxID=418853 RepID=UPI000472E04F|nr:YbaN family protein [Sneathiella glossodoripedis]